MKTETMYSSNKELFRDSDLSEAVINTADNLSDTDSLPQRFTIYEQDFAVMPASHYLCRDFAGYLIERIDEEAYELLGEYCSEYGLFDDFNIDNEKLSADLKAAIDAVFTKHKIQPTTQVAHGRMIEHKVEWSGEDDWKVIRKSES